MAVVPIVGLNKSIQRFIPEADPDKSSLEILVEIFIQIVVMFCGIIIIHRIITYFPTYSGFKYEHLTLTNVVLAFLVIVLSIQTKLGLKVNILFDRLGELWNGSTITKPQQKAQQQSSVISMHAPSQADYLDNTAVQQNMFPPAPVAGVQQQKPSYDTMIRGSGMADDFGGYMGPMAANSVLGGSFGSSF
jgi:hypothetical protein